MSQFDTIAKLARQLSNELLDPSTNIDNLSELWLALDTAIDAAVTQRRADDLAKSATEVQLRRCR